MMCEASEDEVEVGKNPSIKNDSNANESDEPVSKDRGVSHNEIDPNRPEDSSKPENNSVLPCEENISEDKQSNINDSVSNNAPSNERGGSDNDDNVSTGNDYGHVQVENEKQHIESPETHNPRYNVQQASEDSSNPELNGHANGNCVNEGNDKEVSGTHVSGK